MNVVKLSRNPLLPYLSYGTIFNFNINPIPAFQFDNDLRKRCFFKEQNALLPEKCPSKIEFFLAKGMVLHKQHFFPRVKKHLFLLSSPTKYLHLAGRQLNPDSFFLIRVDVKRG